MTRSRKTILNLCQLEGRIAPSLSSTLTWQGDVNAQWGGTNGTNTNWSSTPIPNKVPGDGAALIFPTAPAGNLLHNNNIPDLDLKSLSFTGTGYGITGNAITLADGITANVPAAGTNRFHPDITLKADQTFSSTSAAGAVFEFDTIILNGKTLTVDGAFTVQLAASGNKKVTGQGRLIKNGTGTLTLSFEDDFTGPVEVNAGVLIGTKVGATGAGNGTTIASGASLVFVSDFNGSFKEDLTVSGTGTAGQPGAIVLPGNNVTGPDVNLTGALRLGADATIAGTASLGEKLVLSGLVGAADDALAILTVDSASLSGFSFTNIATFTTDLAGTTPGAGGHDQLKVIGTVGLGGAALNVVPEFTPAIGAKFVIVDNDGTDPIVGTFAGLIEGATVSAGGVNFTISYKGIDGATGNDVVLTVASLSSTPGSVAIGNDGTTATLIDVDGDNVTVKTSKGAFRQSDFKVVATGVGGQLQLINLTAHGTDFTGANLNITAKPGLLGGNGFANVGYINATGIDLGAVKIAGDLGRINAGTVGGDLKVPALKSLDVGSIGLFGTSTQAPNGNFSSTFEGALPKLTVKGDLRDAVLFFSGGADGNLGAVTIGGSVVGTASGQLLITAQAGIGTVKIRGDLRADSNIEVRSEAALGAVSIGGSIYGSGGVTIAAFGQRTAPTAGVDLAIKSLTVAGSVEQFAITAGLNRNNTSGNADASIGSIAVGGDWIASLAVAGVSTGGDINIGNADDGKPGTIDRDNPSIFSSIGSITIKGQALGTAAAGDMFGIVTERIGKAKVGGRAFAFKDGTNEAFFAAPTSPGKGAEIPMFDFTIRELGSATPAITPGGANLDISSDGKTATYTDVDGDLVTVKRSAGAFVTGNFTFTAAGIGAQLQLLQIGTAGFTSPANLSITATPGATGGNGFVNIGQIITLPPDKLGTVSVAGDLGQLDATTGGNFIDPLILSLAVHSFGQLGLNTGATANQVTVSGPLAKFTVATDLRGATVNVDSAKPAVPALGQLTVGGSMIASTITAQAGIGAVKIGRSFRGGAIAASLGPIGTISVGGDVVGTAATAVAISAFGQRTAPVVGLDLALKSFTVKGSVENALIKLGGTGNADASIGAISVGRAWLATSVQAGVKAGTDTFIGTADDTKLDGAGLRDAARVSTIASIFVKGEALGSTTANDSFGIVAEQILKAKIGTRTLKFAKGERSPTDAFVIGVTGPGPAPDNAFSDFFIREITA